MYSGLEYSNVLRWIIYKNPKMHQIDIYNVLNNTIIKVFTIYQLIQLIILELSKYKSKLVIKTEELFLLDSQIDQQ